jgi:hypothetical protein
MTARDVSSLLVLLLAVALAAAVTRSTLQADVKAFLMLLVVAAGLLAALHRAGVL